jgi:hypothetical protein
MMSHPQKAFYDGSFWLIKKLLRIAFPLFFLILPLGCHMNKYQYRQRRPLSQGIENIVVVGFKGAISEGEDLGLFRCPICGATFMAEPVSETIAKEMSLDLFNYLKKVGKYSLIPPRQAKGVWSTILSKGVTKDKGIVEMLQEAGKSFSSNAVFFGYIYRWRERVGKKYGVTSPASIAFDLHLISTENASILWKGSFNKTQLSLSENLLDLSTFIRSRGTWLTARELAQIGLEKLLGNLSLSLNSTNFL